MNYLKRCIVLKKLDGTDTKQFNSVKEVSDFLGCKPATVRMALTNAIFGWEVTERKKK